MSDPARSGAQEEDRASSSSHCRASSLPHYRMDHPRRGVAAVFNHETFSLTGVRERKGSEKDVESLCATLTRLGFEVETFFDLTFSDIVAALEELSQRDHSRCDCFLLVFMSHGLEGKLRSRDLVFDVNCLWDCFTPEQAPTLVGKPKIFIIQACQGHGRQCGVRVEDEVHNSNRDRERVCLVPGYVLPSSPDFLIALSTIPGFVSWRNPERGSWYIQVLCDHLDRQGFEQDLVTLLTHVGREIAIDYSAVDKADLRAEEKKQLPSVISFLVKKVQFTRKGSKSYGNGRKRNSVVSLKDDTDDAEQEGEEGDVQEQTRKKKRRKKEESRQDESLV